MKSPRLLLSVAALSAGAILSGATRAEDWRLVGQLGFLATGKSYEIEKGHIYWALEVSGTFFSDRGEKGLLDHAGFKCPGRDDIYLNSKIIKGDGFCVVTDLDGDQAYAKWQGTGTTGRGSPGGGTFEWTGGTGKYKEINGTNTYVSSVGARWPDGTSTGYINFNR